MKTHNALMRHLILLSVCLLSLALSPSHAAAFGTLDLNEVEPDWKQVLGGACVCPPTPLDDGVVVLTDGRTVMFITERGDVKWHTRIKGRKALSSLTALKGALIAASSGNTINAINGNGSVVWSTALSYPIADIRVVPSGIVCTGGGKETTLGIRGGVKAAREAAKAQDAAHIPSGGQAAGSMGHLTEDIKRKVILPDAAKEAGAYTVMTRGGYLLLFEKSWRVRAWHIYSNGIKQSDNQPMDSSGMEGNGEDGSSLDSKERQGIEQLRGYISTLGIATREKWRPSAYRSDVLGTCAMIKNAATLEVASVSPLLAAAISAEDNYTLLTALLEAAAVQAFDEGDMLEAIGKRAPRINDKEDGTLIALCNAVGSICSFMGGSARINEGITILQGITASRYSIKVRSHCRQCLAALGSNG